MSPTPQLMSRFPKKSQVLPEPVLPKRALNPRPPKHIAKASPLREVLKAWRAAEAKKKAVPAFRIMSDKVMESILEAQPSDEAGLLAISGVGPKLVERYGPHILRVLKR